MKSVAFAAAIYFVVWWIVLFTVLPWGVRSQDEEGHVTKGSEPGAPVRPFLLRKAIATTIVSAIVLAIGYAVWAAGLISTTLIPPALIPPRY